MTSQAGAWRSARRIASAGMRGSATIANRTAGMPPPPHLGGARRTTARRAGGRPQAGGPPAPPRRIGGGRADRGREEPVDVGVAARLRAVRHAELAVDVREVELDGLLGDAEARGDLAVGPALGDLLQDLVLAPGEAAVRRRRLMARR